MMKKIVIGLCCLLVAGVSPAQEITRNGLKDTVMLRRPVPAFAAVTCVAKSNQPVPQNFYAKHLGFFCRQELKMQDAHVPVTFRLGSMENCNFLEQKPGYR